MSRRVFRFFSALLALCVLAGGHVAAQQPSPATAESSGRCTGLFCDLYYAGKPAPTPGVPEAPSPTSLPCHDFLCGAFGGRTSDAPPPPAQQAVVAAEPTPAPAKTSRRKHKAHKAADAASDVAK